VLRVREDLVSELLQDNDLTIILRATLYYTPCASNWDFFPSPPLRCVFLSQRFSAILVLHLLDLKAYVSLT
jgi:hypothetical protein